MKIDAWLHGTDVYFEKWKIQSGPVIHKGGIQAHSAIFFSTNSEFVRAGISVRGGICSAKITEDAIVLDMSSCTHSESEAYRIQVTSKKLGSKSPRMLYAQHWSEGWNSGAIMKYSPQNQDEYTKIVEGLQLSPSTQDSVDARNEFQMLTRNAIEELVVSARELGYDAVIGNEIDTWHPEGIKTYKIMFVLNSAVLTDPMWIQVPNAG